MESGCTFFSTLRTQSSAGRSLLDSGALLPSHGIGGVVFQDEIYALLAGSAWSSSAASFGIPYGARHVTLLLEVPKDWGLIPDTYRQFLRRADGTPDAFTVDRFAETIQALCPGWIRRRLSQLGKRPTMNSRLEREIADIARSVGVEANWQSGSLELSCRSGAQMTISEVICLGDTREIADRWLTDRAAECSSSSEQLFLNCAYPPVLELRSALETYLKNEIGFVDARLQILAGIAAERRLLRRILRAVVLAFAKRDLRNLWSDEHCEKAMSPEALTAASETICEEMAPALAEIKFRLEFSSG